MTGAASRVAGSNWLRKHCAAISLRPNASRVTGTSDARSHGTAALRARLASFSQVQFETTTPAAMSVVMKKDLAYWAKLGMVGGEQVVLSLDLPAECFDLTRFRAAVRTLGHYAQLVSSEVQILSHVDREPELLENLHG